MCDQISNCEQSNHSESIGDFCPPACKQCPSDCHREQQETSSFSSMKPCYSPSNEQKFCKPNCDETYCNRFALPHQSSQEIRCEPCVRIQTPCRRRRYIQPPRRQSFKPIYCYKRPEIPMPSDTIYRRSFEEVDSCTAACCRAQPARPNGTLRIPCAKFNGETVTKLSYQPNCRPERARPIFPQPHSLMGKGPMQGLTTQRHDFVPKFQYRRMKLVPRNNIKKLCGEMEKCTIQNLSFMPPCATSRVQSFKPQNCYKKPELPMERETTQKLSFMPVCPPPRQNFPWADKGKYKAPTLPFARSTVAKLSYQPPGCFIEDNECCYDPCDNVCCYDAPRAAC